MKKSTNKNLTLMTMVATIVLQVFTIISGLIVPRLILKCFGSEVNGLVASISQFLNYIQLLEGGLSGVVMAALYRAIAVDDSDKVSSIIRAADNFFRKIGIIYLLYSVAVAFVYPVFTRSVFSYGYIFSLVLIISFGIFVQYFFSLTYKILINADRRGYVVSLSQTAFVIINFLLVILAINVYPEIHFLKGLCALAYLIQPIVFRAYVKKHYKIDKKAKPDNESIKQRWNGFGQNLAFFIHTNTDIVILTIFTDLKTVSIYSVYLLVINTLKNFVISISGSIKPSFANVLVKGEPKKTNKVFDYYEFGVGIITTFAFACCLCLLTQFVQVYTSHITDANYFQPVFAALMCISEGVYCLRDPYIQVAYCAAKYKETSAFAYIEAATNILISLLLVNRLGLIGVAIGTLVAMIFRMFAHIFYNQKNVIYRQWFKSTKNISLFIVTLAFSYFVTNHMINFNVNSYYSWIIFALICAGIVGIIIMTFAFLFCRNELKGLINTYFDWKEH